MRLSKDNVRERVITVAQALFYRKGIKAVTMNEVATALQMSKRTIYELFEDKEDLLIQCFKTTKQKLRLAVAQEVKDGDTVLHAVLVSMRYLLNEATHMSPTYLLDIERSPRLLAFVCEERCKEEDEVVAYLEQGKEQGLLRKDIDFRVFYRAVQRLQILGDYADFLPTHSLTELFRHTVIAYLRGCATQAGVEQIDLFERSLKNG